MTKGKSVFFLAVLYFGCSGSGIVRAQEIGEWRALRGLQGVHLIVEDGQGARHQVFASRNNFNKLKRDY